MMPPPNPSHRQATTIPRQTPSGKNTNNTNSCAVNRDRSNPSPKANNSMIPTARMLNPLADHRKTRSETDLFVFEPFTFSSPSAKRANPITPLMDARRKHKKSSSQPAGASRHCHRIVAANPIRGVFSPRKSFAATKLACQKILTVKTAARPEHCAEACRGGTGVAKLIHKYGLSGLQCDDSR